MNNDKIIQKLHSINNDLKEINDILVANIKAKDDYEFNNRRKEILENLSSIYINTQLCAGQLKYLKMKECKHIFIKRNSLSCKELVTYCICCGLNNFYDCIDNNNYIMNEEDKILKSCYENTKNNGILLFEDNIDTNELEKITTLYKELNKQTLSREELISKLKQKSKRLAKK